MRCFLCSISLFMGHNMWGCRAKNEINHENALTVEKSTKRKKFDRWVAVRDDKEAVLEVVFCNDS